MDKTEFLARMRQARIDAQGGRGVGRGSAQKSRLLDDADLNIGNAAIVIPQNLTGDAETIPAQNPPRILNLDALSPTGQMITVAITAALVLEPPPVMSQFAGPITAIIEFGNGGVFTRFEVDVPVGPYQANLGPAKNPREPFDGGTVLSIPAGVLRVYARNDARFVTPSVNSTAPTAIIAPDPDPDSPRVIVKAFTCYQPRISGRFGTPRKTLYLGAGDLAPFAAGLTYSVPAFAKSVRLLRDHDNNPVTYTLRFRDAIGMNLLDTRTFAAATPSDFVPVPGTCNNIEITQGAGDTSGPLELEFEIGV